jgi:hypothetical protein
MRLCLVANGKFVAATGATTAEYCATVGGFHTGPKTVGLRAFTVVRLESTFRHCVKF